MDNQKQTGRKWDGKSRISNETYRKRWNEIFKDKDKEEEMDSEDAEYLEELKKKL
tara:strand:+ start:41 stop:205 length:165 start_codon:yes stop_codon:yes gene_type:complete